MAVSLVGGSMVTPTDSVGFVAVSANGRTWTTHPVLYAGDRPVWGFRLANGSPAALTAYGQLVEAAAPDHLMWRTFVIGGAAIKAVVQLPSGRFVATATVNGEDHLFTSDDHGASWDQVPPFIDFGMYAAYLRRDALCYWPQADRVVVASTDQVWTSADGRSWQLMRTNDFDYPTHLHTSVCPTPFGLMIGGRRMDFQRDDPFEDPNLGPCVLTTTDGELYHEVLLGDFAPETIPYEVTHIVAGVDVAFAHVEWSPLWRTADGTTWHHANLEAPTWWWADSSPPAVGASPTDSFAAVVAGNEQNQPVLQLSADTLNPTHEALGDDLEPLDLGLYAEAMVMVLGTFDEHWTPETEEPPPPEPAATGWRVGAIRWGEPPPVVAH